MSGGANAIMARGSFEKGAESLHYETVDANLRNAIINDPTPFTPFAFQMFPTKSPRQLGLVSGDEIPVRSAIDRHQARRMFFRWAAGRDYMYHDDETDANKDSSAARPEKLPRIHIRRNKRRIVIRESSSSDSSNSSNNRQTSKAHNRSANCNP